MDIGQHLRKLREERDLAQNDMEKRTGLPRTYISRVENGHTVPSLEILQKLADALKVPLYQLFYEGEVPPPEKASARVTKKLKRAKKERMSEDARLVFGTLAKAYSNL